MKNMKILAVITPVIAAAMVLGTATMAIADTPTPTPSPTLSGNINLPLPIFTPAPSPTPSPTLSGNLNLPLPIFRWPPKQELAKTGSVPWGGLAFGFAALLTGGALLVVRRRMV